jgi:hypothetical protein
METRATAAPLACTPELTEGPVHGPSCCSHSSLRCLGASAPVPGGGGLPAGPDLLLSDHAGPRGFAGVAGAAAAFRSAGEAVACCVCFIPWWTQLAGLAVDTSFLGLLFSGCWACFRQRKRLQARTLALPGHSSRP